LRIQFRPGQTQSPKRGQTTSINPIASPRRQIRNSKFEIRNSDGPTGNQELRIEHSALGRVGGNSKLKTKNSELMCVRDRPKLRIQN
jgi:hypothetical protein